MPEPVTIVALSQLKVTWQRWFFLVAGLALLLAILACAFLGPGSRPAPDRIVIRTRLATFTRTPLPTLTPTATATPPGAAPPAEAALIPPTLALSQTGLAATPAAPIPSQASASPDALTLSLPATNAAPFPAGSKAQLPPEANTPTSIPTATATEIPLPTSAPTATATEAPTPTGTPTATPTETPLSAGWVFTGVRLYPGQYEDGLLLYGNLINNTGSPQELEFISGTFYDAQGQQVAGDDSTSAYWPALVIPPGGDMPFEVTVDDVEDIANFELSVEAEPGGELPRQDFEFLDINQGLEQAAYCVGGALRNPGGGLQKYLIIALVLYDGQNKVINFGDYTEYGPTRITGEQTLTFKICVGPPNQDVARYELRAWGR